MKKITILFIVSLMIFFFYGCGQDVNVTVYNSTGINSSTGWIAINVNSENNDNWFEPTDYANNDSDCGPDNSITIKIKENSTIKVTANGYYYDYSQPTPVLTSFEVQTSTATIYGGFPEPPNWYASVNLESVIIYKK